MNSKTADNFRTACSRVLETVSALDTPIDELKTDDVLIRFQNLSGQRFAPRSLAAYKQRLGTALSSYREYLAAPDKWKAPSAGNRANGSRARRAKPKEEASRQGHPSPPQDERLISYPFPVRPSLTATLQLPRDLRRSEAERMKQFLDTIAFDDSDIADAARTQDDQPEEDLPEAQ